MASQSATNPILARSKISASASLLIATTVAARLRPQVWLGAPRTPIAIYRRGSIALPVNPTCNCRGTHPLSVTRRVAPCASKLPDCFDSRSVWHRSRATAGDGFSRRPSVPDYATVPNDPATHCNSISGAVAAVWRRFSGDRSSRTGDHHHAGLSPVGLLGIRTARGG